LICVSENVLLYICIYQYRVTKILNPLLLRTIALDRHNNYKSMILELLCIHSVFSVRNYTKIDLAELQAVCLEARFLPEDVAQGTHERASGQHTAVDR